MAENFFLDNLDLQFRLERLNLQEVVEIKEKGYTTVNQYPAAPRNYNDAKRSDTKHYARFFREMLDRGIFLAPSQFEAAFVSAAHRAEDVSRTIAAARDSLQMIASELSA